MYVETKGHPLDCPANKVRRKYGGWQEEEERKKVDNPVKSSSPRCFLPFYM
jgi:hypothetical protein